MPTNHTPHYNLSQWERDDRILMDDFNADNAKIDAALAAHAAALAGKGNCRVETSGYIGQTSQDRLGLTHTLTFPKRPALVLIFGGASLCVISGVSDEVFYIGLRLYPRRNRSRKLVYFLEGQRRHLIQLFTAYLHG